MGHFSEAHCLCFSSGLTGQWSGPASSPSFTFSRGGKLSLREFIQQRVASQPGGQNQDLDQVWMTPQTYPTIVVLPGVSCSPGPRLIPAHQNPTFRAPLGRTRLCSGSWKRLSPLPVPSLLSRYFVPTLSLSHPSSHWSPYTGSVLWSWISWLHPYQLCDL